MGVYNFESLNEHVGHNIAVVNYVGLDGKPVNASVKCEDCNCVLFSYDKPAPRIVSTPDPENLKKFKVYCTELLEYEVEVLAHDLEEAIDQVKDNPPEYDEAIEEEFTSFVASEVKDEQ